MLLLVESAAVLRKARTRAGLSRRALAAKAGVPTSTVSRIEDSLSEPTLTMLKKLVNAAGSELVVESQPREDLSTLAELSNAWTDHDGRMKIDWTRLRAFVDRMELHPKGLPAAIADSPAPTHQLVNAILASLAEQLADEHHVERPRWARGVGPLDQPWSPPSTPRMQRSAVESTPPAFMRRNIIIPRSALFRSVV